MKFISTICPYCKKELQVPDDAENIVCMYCAQPIDVKSLLENPNKNSAPDYKRLMDEAESLLNDEIFSHTVGLKNIKDGTYADDFQGYNSLISPALKAYCLAATENDEAADYFAGVLFDRFQKQFELNGIKKESDLRFFDCRYMIVAFTVPAILEQNTPAAEALADSFLAKWNAYYSKNPLGKSTFDNINSGFRKKLCFITTAVCSSLGKEDDCAELNTLREFRDGWLSETSEGKAKICEYYLFAPMIVSAIDQSSDKQAVYSEIWQNHLSPCLETLNTGNSKKCAEQYENMILELERTWLN